MNWALISIGLAAVVLMFREIRTIQKERAILRREQAWPLFEETYISGLQSGISIADTFSFANDFELPEVGSHVKEIVNDIDRGVSIAKTLERFKNRMNLEHADLFASIVSLAHRTGGQNLVSALTEHAGAVRFELASKGDVRARQNAILTVAKLGLLAPWILVAVLSINEQTRSSFNTLLGQSLLVAGFAISFLAYRMVIAAGRSSTFVRILGASDG